MSEEGWTGPLRALLGEGGQATVHASEDERGQVLAVKLIREEYMPEGGQRLQREFETLQRLEHPCFPKVYATGGGQQAWMSMELVEGESLAESLPRWSELSGPQRWEQAERVLRSLLAGLSYLHERGIVHRDIKPANIMVELGEQERVLLLDFGGVRDDVHAQGELTAAGQLMGTVAFMSPEQILGDPVDHRTDLYGLGLVLYMMLTGEHPIQAEGVSAYLTQQLSSTPAPPSRLSPGMPRGLERVCLQMLKKRPEQRPSSAQAVLKLLESQGSRQTGLLGRQAELDALDALLAAVQPDRQLTLCVRGLEGSGRSSLLEELTLRARERGLTVLQPSMTGAADLWILDPCPEQPPAREGRSPLIACSLSADQEVPAWLADSSERLELLDLEGLGEGDCKTLLREQGLGPAASSRLAARLALEEGGLPGACLMRMQALREAGWLEQRGERLRLKVSMTTLRDEPLPLSSREGRQLLQWRSGLEEESRKALDWLTVLNAPCSISTFPFPFESRFLDTLLRSGLIRWMQEGSVRWLEWRARSARQFLYEALSSEERRRWHAEAAEALRGRRWERRHPLELALHYERAELLEASWGVLSRAAQRQRSREDSELMETLSALRRLGSQLRPRPADGPDWMRELSLRFEQQQDLSQAAEVIEELLRSQETPSSGDRLSRARLLIRQGSYSEGERELDALETEIGPDLRLAWRLTRAWSAGLQARAEALGMWEEILASAESSLLSERERGLCWLGQGEHLLHCGALQRAEISLIEAERQLRRAEAVQLSRALAYLGWVYHLRGSPESRACVEEAQQLGRDRKNHYAYALSLAVQAEISRRGGDRAHAETLLESAQSIAESLDAPVPFLIRTLTGSPEALPPFYQQLQSSLD